MFETWRASRREKAAGQRAREQRRRIIDEVRDAVGAAEPVRVEPAARKVLGEALGGPAGRTLAESLDGGARVALDGFRAALGGELDPDEAQRLAEAIDAGSVATAPLDLLEAVENWAAYLADPARDHAHLESVLWLTVLAQDDPPAALEEVRRRLGAA